VQPAAAQHSPGPARGCPDRTDAITVLHKIGRACVGVERRRRPQNPPENVAEVYPNSKVLFEPIMSALQSRAYAFEVRPDGPRRSRAAIFSNPRRFD
jgi:hypothetical protein